MYVYNLEKVDRILKVIMSKSRKLVMRVVFGAVENRRITENH